MPATLQLFAACLPGLEPLLAGELRALGVEPRSVAGGATFAGDVATVQRACLWLGTASHLRIRLAEFRCRALGELQRKASELPWTEWLSRHVPLGLQAAARSSRVYHTKAIEERIHNAIAAAFGETPRMARPDDEFVAQVAARFHDDVCTISLDATSTPLHRRGYRLDGRKAPLREDIAHALVLVSGRATDEALLDPFCGSGTIPIEAAGLALGLPPGRLRDPALQHTALFDPDVWETVRTERGRPADGAPPAPIAASDRDAGAVEATQQNAARAGVADAIEYHTCAVAAQPWLQPGAAPPRGVVVTNPPFGLRVRGKSTLLPLYQTLGHRVKRLGDGWRATVLAHDVRLARRTGLPLQPAFTTRHGGLSITAMATAVTGEDLADEADGTALLPDGAA